MFPDHPVIARIERTGDPHQNARHECQNCGGCAVAYSDTSGYLCEDCLTAEWLSLPVADRAERLYMEVIDDS